MKFTAAFCICAFLLVFIVGGCSSPPAAPADGTDPDNTLSVNIDADIDVDEPVIYEEATEAETEIEAETEAKEEEAEEMLSFNFDEYELNEHALNVPSLKEIYKDYFIIGNIVNPDDFGGGTTAKERYSILKHHYNALTFENFMKPDSMWGPGNVYNQPSVPAAKYTELDGYMRRLINDGFEVIGHTLTWHSQSPNWLNLSAGKREKADGRIYKSYEEAQINLKLFIDTVAGRYYNRADGLYIHTWDVLNEAIRKNNAYSISSENWGYHTVGAIWIPNGEQWNSPWYMCYGTDAPEGVSPWDYVYDAFMYTRLADSGTILQYNDYNMQEPDKVRIVVNMVNAVNMKWALDTENNPQADSRFTSVQEYLEADGRLLIESIGMQEHDKIDTNLRHIENAIKEYIKTGARISITELDVGVSGYKRGEKLSEEDEIKQGLYFAELFNIFKKYHENIDRVSFWGVTDINWRSDELCQIFNPDFTAKLAYYAVADPDWFLAKYGK